jgi:hypothetical protein
VSAAVNAVAVGGFGGESESGCSGRGSSGRGGNPVSAVVDVVVVGGFAGGARVGVLWSRIVGPGRESGVGCGRCCRARWFRWGSSSRGALVEAPGPGRESRCRQRSTPWCSVLPTAGARVQQWPPARRRCVAVREPTAATASPAGSGSQAGIIACCGSGSARVCSARCRRRKSVIHGPRVGRMHWRPLGVQGGAKWGRVRLAAPFSPARLFPAPRLLGLRTPLSARPPGR